MKKIFLISVLLFLLSGCAKEVSNPFDNIDVSEPVVFKEYVRQSKGILVPIKNCTYLIKVDDSIWDEYDKESFVSLEKNYFEFDPKEMTIYDNGSPFYTLDCNLKVENPVDSMLREGVSYRPGFKPGQTFMIHNDTYYLFDWPKDILEDFLSSTKRLEVIFDLNSDSKIYTDGIAHKDILQGEEITYYNLYNADFISLKK